MTERLTIIDNETRTELADLGMSVGTAVAPAKICEECRFRRMRFRDYSSHKLPCCAVYDYGRCGYHNPDGTCERWEAKSPSTLTATIVRNAAFVGAGTFLGFILRGCL